MKRMKRAYASRIACGQAMQEELERKFPTTKFELAYFDPSSWDTHSYEGMQYMMDNRMKYGQTLGDIKKCVRVIWDDGAAKIGVQEVTDKYLQYSVVKMDDGIRRIPNVGFDENGNPTQMGLFKEIFIERDISNDAFDELSEHDLENIDSLSF